MYCELIIYTYIYIGIKVVSAASHPDSTVYLHCRSIRSLRNEDHSKGGKKKTPSSHLGHIQNVLTRLCSYRQHVRTIKKCLCGYTPPKTKRWNKEEKVKLQAWNCNKKKKKIKSPGVYVAYHMTLDTVTRII